MRQGRDDRGPVETRDDRDTIESLGVRTFINAAGTYTVLTASLMRPEVVEAMRRAAEKYVMLDELHDAAGERIAQLLGVPAALVTSGCASALMLATAACVAGRLPKNVRRLPDVSGLKNEVVIQRAHRVEFDRVVGAVGARLVEVRTARQLRAAIGDRTAMLFFLNFAAPLGRVGHEEFLAIAREHGVPTLLDAAADLPPVENLWKYVKMGFDLVAFSGGKGLRGPQNTGLLLGREKLIEAARAHNSPRGNAIGRTNKVSKEAIVGLLKAIELYVDNDHAADWRVWERRCRTIAEALSELDDVRTRVVVPEIANAVPHLHVRWDRRGRGLGVAEMVDQLRSGRPSIELRPGAGREDELIVSVWMMRPGEAAIVGERIRAVLKHAVDWT